MLSVLGGALGILFAYWGAQAIISFVSINSGPSAGICDGSRPPRTWVHGHDLAAYWNSFRHRSHFSRCARGFDAGAEGRRAKPGQYRTGRKMVQHGQRARGGPGGAGHRCAGGCGTVGAHAAEFCAALMFGFDSHNILISESIPTLIGYKGAQVDALLFATCRAAWLGRRE